MSDYLNQLFGLGGKTALVTGAANGNGAAIATGLANAGAEVILLDNDAKNLENLAKELMKVTESVKTICCDLSNVSEVSGFCGSVGSDFEKVDILINNAGITISDSFFDYSDENWDMTYRVNLLAPFKIAKAVAALQVQHKYGSIINITSLNAELAFPDNPAYVTFKGALKQLTKSMALDLGRYNIRVNNLAPGYIKTNMTKKSWDDLSLRKAREDKTVLNRWGMPADLVGTVIYLASAASSYLTGQDIYVDGGWLIKGL